MSLFDLIFIALFVFVLLSIFILSLFLVGKYDFIDGTDEPFSCLFTPFCLSFIATMFIFMAVTNMFGGYDKMEYFFTKHSITQTTQDTTV